MIIPLEKSIGVIKAPTVNEVNGANNIIEGVRLKNLINGGLIMEVAKLQSNFDGQTGAKFKIIIKRMFEFILVKPIALNGADGRIVKNEFIKI